jgi:spermidine synthase
MEYMAETIAAQGTNRGASDTKGSVHWWYLLFFVSGFPALLYQIVWQRALFAIYGVNIESVTIVVTAFMLGLGLGSLAGGWLSAREKAPLLLAFGFAELGIAIFGLFSLKIFHAAAVFSAGAPPLMTSVMAFALVVIPTMLMGCTLPLLVAHTVRINANVGVSVGILYAVNTLGSAAACFVAGRTLLWRLGGAGSVRFAVLLNTAVGLVVLFRHFRRRGSTTPDASPQEGPGVGSEGSAAPLRMHFGVAMVLVGVSGLIALAYEILWYRLFSYVTGTLARSFAYLLGAYLLGIGLGSLWSERLCSRQRGLKNFLGYVAWFVLIANVIGFLVAPSLAQLAIYKPFVWALPVVMIAAAFLGACFPLICHVSVAPDHRAGTRLSYLYLSNILGSALGSYLVGFVLMDFLNTTQVAMVLALSGIALSGAIFVAVSSDKSHRAQGLLAVMAALLAVAVGSQGLFERLYEKMLFKQHYQSGVSYFRWTKETRSGVIHVMVNGHVYGGGVYDGAFSTDLVNDQNGIVRAYAVAAFHPHPQDVLVIGVASGSWAQVIAHHPDLQQLTLVEINPGYYELIKKVPQVRSLLTNPKVVPVVDDGRRWLIAHPNARFDLIVMNTTFHWRAHASNLLSQEFLQMVRTHLKSGGQLFYNTTASDRVFATGVRTFRHGLRVANFLVLSDTEIHFDKERWREILSHYQIDGTPVFHLDDPRQVVRLEQVLSLGDRWNQDPTSMSLEYQDSIQKRTKAAKEITDDNMGTEWDPTVDGTQDY